MNAPLPIAAVLGEIELAVGTGLLIVNVLAADVPPPGVGVNTVTDAVPAVAMSAAVIWACSWPWLTKVVVRLLPFHRTTEVIAKLLLFEVAVRVKAAPPAVTLVGEIELRVGAGFVDVMLNVFAAEVPPPGVGLNTVTEELPVAAMSLARIWA